MLVGIKWDIFIKQGTNIIKANTIGNKTVQQYVINLSECILGNKALIHIKSKYYNGRFNSCNQTV